MESVQHKSAKLPAFSGNREDFPVWWRRFQAYAKLHKFHQCLKNTAENNLPNTEEEVAGQAEAQKKARERNELAMLNFALAFNSNKLIALLAKANTDKYPNGKAHLVVAELMKKYKPGDTVSRVELRQELNKVSMKKDEDPVELFEELALIEAQFSTTAFKVPEEDLIAAVLTAAPEKYKAALTVKQVEKGNNLTLDDLEHTMNSQWRLSTAGKNHGYSEGREVTFVANDESNGNEKSSENKKNATCTYCGKKGHWAVNCWDNPENKDNVPDWYKPKETGEVAAACTYEVLF